jgi:exodeoxyribonuclease X
MRQVIVIDTETTGFEAATNSLVEFAAVIDEHWYHSLVKPTTPISFGAMATHHITPDMVEDAPSLDDVISNFVSPEDDVVLVAHNAGFDMSFMPEWLRAKEWICTWRCALHIYPDAESHSNQSLRYELGLDVSDLPPEAGGMAHRALYDAWVTAKLYARIVADSGKSVEELVELTKAPVLQKKVRFGKHANQLWSEVPKDYLRWVLRQDFDRDVLHTAEFHLR